MFESREEDANQGESFPKEFQEAVRKRNFETAADLVESADIPTLKSSFINQEDFDSLCQKVPYSLAVIQSLYSRYSFC